ncbi:MAG: peptidase S41, partial [Prevotella sp.]|nr:peptidase S41 [Prevotella sp.]
MKKTNLLFLLTILLSMVTVEVQAQDGPLWLRYPAISPDGKTIAFAYQGNIFTVSSNGGEARQLTSHTGYDAYPVWSPDGKKIAFASTRKGSYDVYLMDANGGTPTRLTTSSGSEKPMAFLDNDHVLFTASVMPTAKSIIFPGDYNEVYSVSVNGGRPALFSAIDMNDVCVGTDGAVLYHDHKGYEDPFRKHHTSPITRDIWMMQNGKFTKVTDFKGEDRTPRWAADGKSFFYTSEEDGTFNVYRKNIDGSGKKRLTEFKRNPVRFLSVSKSDDLCFTYDGEIYVMKQGQTSPSKVKISIFADTEGDKLQRQILSSGATEMTVSPNGKEVAFVLRGDIYVTNVEFKTTKQITDTPEQERNVQFSPDGKSLVYAAERDGLWQIYQTRIRNKAERQFAYATDLDEERLVQSDRTSQLPKYSPDGKKVAFLEDRGSIRTIDLKTKEVKTCLDGKYMYSYSDGDVDYNWSPDGRWFVCTYIGVGGWNNTDLALVSSSGNGEIHNLTNSGYS